MATDRDEQQRQPPERPAGDHDEQQRQAQELEEIRRSFAEMGARMGSLFEPADVDQPEPATAAEVPPAAPARPRWRAGVLVLLFVAGALVGWILPRGDGQSASPPPTQPTTATTRAKAAAPPPSAGPPRTRVVVPDSCLDTAELADEVISRLNRNIRDDRLFLAIRDYTVASQACRKEASP